MNMCAKIGLLSILITIFLPFTALKAQLVLSNSSTINIDFSGFDGSGLKSGGGGGTLDSDEWKVLGASDGSMDFGDTQTSGDFARGLSSGGTSSGGFFAFDVNGDTSVIAAGFQPTSGDFTPGAIILKIRNNTGSEISGLEVSFDRWINNNEDRSNTLLFGYQSTEPVDSSDTGTIRSTFMTNGASDANGFQSFSSGTVTIYETVANGSDLFLIWNSNDDSGSGSRDELGISNISITPFSLEYDFGDAPSPFPTLLASDGARHVIDPSVFMGTGIDNEPDGQPSADADGDDTTGIDDDDGVSFDTQLRLATAASVTLQVSVQGLLNGWIDYNGDGDWDDSGEHFLYDEKVFAGSNTIDFTVPATAEPGITTYARFRYSTFGGLNYTGEVLDGEVEDYLVFIEHIPEIEVLGNGQIITDGDLSPSVTDHTNFESADILSATVSRTFTVRNTGLADLILSGSPKVAITGANASDFTLTSDASSPVAAGGGTTTFTVLFDPTAEGVRTAQLSIANDDMDENPYNFKIQGTGTAAPEMDVTGNGSSISDGDTSPAALDDTDFGTNDILTDFADHTFTIINSGSGPLSLSGSPVVVITGADASNFSVRTQPSSP